MFCGGEPLYLIGNTVMNAGTAQTERDPHYHDLLELFERLSFAERVHRIVHGLKQPKDSGEHKWAKLQLVRLSAPVAAVLLPVLVLLLLILWPRAHSPDRLLPAVMLTPKATPELDPIQPLDYETPATADPVNIHTISDMIDRYPLAPAPISSAAIGPQLADIHDIPMIRSLATMRTIYARSPGARERAMRKGGAPSGVECAVLRALRWLKREQHADGYWSKQKHAMTGLALLAYLAHGDTPASDEFGLTVESAIRWLVENQGADGGFPRRYEHAIATYALCEAYGMTRVPAVKYAAERAVDIIIKGQNPTGGWDYGLNSTARDDTSVMGWCAQALKAADLTGLENEGLKESMDLAIKGFQKNAHPSGGFGYTGPGEGGLTGVGVLCMQLLGAAGKPEARSGLLWLSRATFDWKEPWGSFPIYYWYYITQAKFHAGGNVWKAWNRQFATGLIRNQIVLKGAGVNDEDIGYWEPPAGKKGHSDGPVMDTALCTLQLEVYYRNLRTLEEVEQPDEGEDVAGDDDVDIRVVMQSRQTSK